MHLTQMQLVRFYILLLILIVEQEAVSDYVINFNLWMSRHTLIPGLIVYKVLIHTFPYDSEIVFKLCGRGDNKNVSVYPNVSMCVC